jgi:hypothetical protein
MDKQAETLTERAAVYWDTLEEGDTINPEQLFEMAKGPRDLGEDIKYVRSFLSGQTNEGKATLIPGQSPPTYRKMNEWTSITDICTRVFNDIPEHEEMTTVSFTNKLPQLVRDNDNLVAIRSFLYRAKLAGAAVNAQDDKGRVKYNGKSVIIQKVKNIEGTLPNKGQVPRMVEQIITTEEKPPVMTIETLADMKASEVGKAIFSFIQELMKENARQKDRIEILVDLKDQALEQNKKLVADHNDLLLEIAKMRELQEASEDPTFRELTSKSQ